MKQIEVGKNDADQRLDKFLGKAFPNLSKSLMYKSIRNKKIKVNRKRCAYDQILHEGDFILLFLPPDTITKKKRTVPTGSHALSIVYEDSDILIIDKPKGLLSQSDRADHSDCVVERIQKYLYDKGEYDLGEHSFAPAVCHRLDRNTEGLIIGCKNARSLRIMNAAIAQHKIKKYYIANVVGTPKTGVMTFYIKKEGTKASVCLKKQAGYQKAQMCIRIRSKKAHYSEIEVELYTGRFHQIRAGMASVGHPLVGDVKYGYRGKERTYVLKAYKLDIRRVDIRSAQKIFEI